MNDKTLGEIIKSHRKLANLSQVELADLCGIGKTTIFDIKKNKETVSWKSIKSVLHILNIKIHFESPIKAL